MACDPTAVLQSNVHLYRRLPPALQGAVMEGAFRAQSMQYDVYEPYLMQNGFLQRTPRGRVATRRAYEHLHIAFSQKGQQGLF